MNPTVDRPAGDAFRIPEPMFAEWSYYNIDYDRLSALQPRRLCTCDASGAGPATLLEMHSSASACEGCEQAMAECQKELEKASSFLHLKGGELEHGIRRCEGFLQTLASLDADEQLVGLGQTEEAVGAIMAQVLALARFRRSNFAGFWRQMLRLQDHCQYHYNTLLESLALSPIYNESTLETHQLFRISQLYAAIQTAYLSSGGAGSQGTQMFPSLACWRGWVDPRCFADVHRLICARMSVVCTPPADARDVSRTTDAYEDPETIHRQCTPPSPAQTHKSSSSSLVQHGSRASRTRSNRSAALSDIGSNILSMYLDNDAMSKYHAGLATEASARSTLALTWIPSSSQTGIPVRMSHSVYSGPWFAARQESSQVILMPDHVLPFLHSEMNLNKLPYATLEPDYYRPESPDTETESKAQRREQLRNAQKIQKQIIMEDLKPTMAALERRIEYYDPSNPGLRIVMHRNIQLSQSDPDSNFRWLEHALGAEGHPSLDNFDYQLPFDAIEVHLGSESAEMPDWLARLFFESKLVHAVLDFDIYIHGIASLCTTKVSELPYWVVDCSRKSYARSSCVDGHVEITVDLPTESSPLLPSPSQSVQSRRSRRRRGYSTRYFVTLALLAATAFSIAFTTWPYHDQIFRILIELADLIVQWISRLLHLKY